MSENKSKKFIYNFFSKLFVVSLSVFLLGYYIHTYAIASPYQPGQTLDPACTPTDTNCYVQILPDQTGNSGKFLMTDGSVTSWGSLTSSQWITTGSDIYYTAGNVGIGVSNPSESLDVDGNIHLSSSGLIKWDNLTGADTPGLDWFKDGAFGSRLRADGAEGDLVYFDTTTGAEVERFRVDRTGGILSYGDVVATGFNVGTSTGSGLSYITGSSYTATTANAISLRTFTINGFGYLDRLLVSQGDASGASIGKVSVQNANFLVETGKVGIGTTTPDEPLVVMGGQVNSLDTFLKFNAGRLTLGAAFGSVNSNAPSIDFYDTQTNQVGSRIGYGGPNTGISITNYFSGLTTPAVYFDHGLDANTLMVAYGINAYGIASRVGIGTATPSSRLDVVTDNLGSNQTTASGIALSNTHTSANGLQQMSPALRWSGHGWKTDAVAGSQDVDFRAFVTPVQGSANPTGYLGFGSSINGGAYNDNQLVLTSAGNVGIANTTPGYLLHVGSSGVTTGTTVARFENAGGTCDIVPSTAGGITCTSDERLKKNITTLADTILDKVLSVRLVKYNLVAESDGTSFHSGVIAQELEQIFPDLVQTDMRGFKSVSYVGFVPYAIKAIQEMNLKIEGLSSLDTENANSLGLLIKNFLGSVSNSLDIVFFGEVHVKKLCLEDVCVTKDQLQLLLNNINSGGGPIDPPPLPTDICPNIDDVQSELPTGYHLDETNNCIADVTPPPDPTPTPPDQNTGDGAPTDNTTTP